MCVYCLLCVCVGPLGSMSLSIRVKGLQKNRWFFRVYNDPLGWNGKCVRESLHKLSVSMCVSVYVCALQTYTLANNANFVCPLARVWLCRFKCKRLWVHTCVKSVCLGIGIPSPRAIRGQTDPIMFVLGDQIGCIPSRLPACWCSFQPVWTDYSIHFMLWTYILISWCFLGDLFGCSVGYVPTCFNGFRDYRFYWPESRMWSNMSARTETVCLFWKRCSISWVLALNAVDSRQINKKKRIKKRAVPSKLLPKPVRRRVKTSSPSRKCSYFS